MEAERLSLETERDRLEDEIKQTQQTIAETTTTSRNLKQALANSRSELARLDLELKNEIESRSILARLPKTRLSFKKEFPVVLRYGKLYRLRRRNGTWNSDEFLLDNSGSTVQLRPKPYRGLSISAATDLPSRLDGILDGLNPAFDYVCVIVWQDSFADFEPLKRVLVQLNYDYRLVLVEHGGKVTSGFAKPWVQ